MLYYTCVIKYKNFINFSLFKNIDAAFSWVILAISAFIPHFTVLRVLVSQKHTSYKWLISVTYEDTLALT